MPYVIDMSLGPFNGSSTSYLLVADYNQRTIYQLQPATGELRSLFTYNIFSVALALDPHSRIVYVSYVEGFRSQQYHIRKRSFDGNINSIIYTAQSGTVAFYS